MSEKDNILNITNYDPEKEYPEDTIFKLDDSSIPGMLKNKPESK